MITTRIIAAKPGDAESIAGGAPCESVDGRGLEQVQLATLLCIVCDEDWEDEVLDEFEPLYAASAQGPWLFLIPARLARVLAFLDDENAAAAASEWSETEEFQRETDPAATAKNALALLRNVAKFAKKADLELLLKISL